MNKKIIFALIIVSLSILAFQTSPYARRIRPFSSTPSSCQENEIGYNMSSHALVICTNSGYQTLTVGGSGSFAPVGAPFITKTADATLTNEFALSTLATGILKNTTTTGIPTIATAGDVNSILPTQTSNSGRFLTTNGTVSSWATVSTGITNSAGNNVIPKSDGTNLVASHITEVSDRNNIPALNGGEYDATFFGSDSGWVLSSTTVTDTAYTPNGFLAVLENVDSGELNSVTGALAGVYDKRSSGEYSSEIALNLDTIKTGSANVGLMSGISMYVWNQTGGTIGNIWGLNVSLESDAGHITGDAIAIRVTNNFISSTTTDGKSIGLLINNQANSAAGGVYAIYYDATNNIFAVKGNGLLQVGATITSGGTTGAQTIDKSAGAVNFAATDSSLVVTNSLVSTNSIVMCTVATNDTTLKSVQCVPASGSFTMFGNAAATAETRVNFFVINQ